MALGLQQQEAALEMRVSRQTLALLLKAGRYKVLDCLTHGKALMTGSSHPAATESAHSFIQQDEEIP